MRRFKLTIAYDGSQYYGWQVQKGQVTVQQCVEEAFQKLFPSVKRIHSSSRTDTGVHALGMVAHVDLPKDECRMDGYKLQLAVNAFLPADIRVMKAVRARGDFHARFDAKGKQYRYLIWNDPVMNPLLIGRAWHVPSSLDVQLMDKAANLFIGKKDFKSFATTREYEMETTVRRLTRCDVRKRGAKLTVAIEGEGFLYKMCRGIVGTLARVGHGKLVQKDIRTIFQKRDRRVGGMNAPADGLTLMKVKY